MARRDILREKLYESTSTAHFMMPAGEQRGQKIETPIKEKLYESTSTAHFMMPAGERDTPQREAL